MQLSDTRANDGRCQQDIGVLRGALLACEGQILEENQTVLLVLTLVAAFLMCLGTARMLFYCIKPVETQLLFPLDRWFLLLIQGLWNLSLRPFRRGEANTAQACNNRPEGSSNSSSPQSGRSSTGLEVSFPSYHFPILYNKYS